MIIKSRSVLRLGACAFALLLPIMAFADTSVLDGTATGFSESLTGGSGSGGGFGTAPTGSNNPISAAGLSGGTAEALAAIRQTESNGNYQAVNGTTSAIGAYQMTTAARDAAGYGNMSAQDFLNCNSCQDQAAANYAAILQNELNANGASQYVGQTVDGVQVTQAGELTGAWQLGAGGLNKALTSGNLSATGGPGNNAVSGRMSQLS